MAARNRPAATTATQLNGSARPAGLKIITETNGNQKTEAYELKPADAAEEVAGDENHKLCAVEASAQRPLQPPPPSIAVNESR